MIGRRLAVGLFAAAAVACDPGSPFDAEPVAPAGPAVVSAPRGASAARHGAPLPSDAAGLLRELAPLPDGAVVIVYDVLGPAGLSGTLEVLAAEGGYRRDNWTLRLPLPDGTREIRGSSVTTPESSWRAEGDGEGMVEPARLGALATAIAALDPVTRARVVEELRSWRAELETARAEDPGERERVAGIDCVRVRAGGGEVCTWEEAGLPLRYDGATFSLVATHVERGAELGVHAFDIPAGAARTPLSPEHRELAPRLAAIAAGDRAEILRLVVVDSFPSLTTVAPQAAADHHPS